jgi:hypothetical protein
VQPSNGLTNNGWFDNLGGTPYVEPDTVPQIDTMTREYALYGDDTMGGFASPIDVIEGAGILGGSFAAESRIFGAVTPKTVPEPPLALLMVPGLCAIGLKFHRKR